MQQPETSFTDDLHSPLGHMFPALLPKSFLALILRSMTLYKSKFTMTRTLTDITLSKSRTKCVLAKYVCETIVS